MTILKLWRKSMTAKDIPIHPTRLTEARNPATEHIDLLPTVEMVHLMNAEDARVAHAVAAEVPHIARAIDAIAERMRSGGRLIYIGAGTSGRLGMLDAVECPPTFNSPPGAVVAVVAGGCGAFTHSSENAEDSSEAGLQAIRALDLSTRDSLVGIAASGQMPYTLSGMAEARRQGALVISLACNHPSPMASLADINFAPITGPEVINGSTRLEAGSAPKMVLNMLSTGVMIRLGKTYGNLMVDVQPNNDKLRERAQWIVEQACGLSHEEAAARLETCGGEVKVATDLILDNWASGNHPCPTDIPLRQFHIPHCPGGQCGGGSTGKDAPNMSLKEETWSWTKAFASV
jgi:N-acetylmuramic acid 6-phosphate etherase